MSDTFSIALVSPVYHDWQSFKQLVVDIDRILIDQAVVVTIVAVNDDLKMFVPQDLSQQLARTINQESRIGQIKLVHVVRNLGHQRAIALGLVSLRDYVDFDAIIVMDADGEDRPQDIIRLIEAYRQYPQKIIVAQRKKRQESWRFRLFYRLYKWTYRLITGQYIDFGNYVLIPDMFYEALIYDANLWNHLAATIQRSFKVIHKIPTDRGKRYAGRSNMNFQGLFIHGLSAISVYLDVVALRAVIVFSFLTLMAIIGIILVFGIVLFTDLAIPGWATSAVGLLTILGFQSLLLAIGATVMILNQRSSRKVIPALDVAKFIKDQEIIFQRDNNKSTGL